MGECGNSELTSSHRYTKITAFYRATIDEKQWMTSRKDLLQQKIKRRSHNKMGRRGAYTGWSGPICLAWKPMRRMNILPEE